MRWLSENIHRDVPGGSGELFKELQAFFDIKHYHGGKSRIFIFADKLKYEPKKGELLTTVTLRCPGLPNVISCRKLVIKPPGKDLSDFPNNEVTSGLFE